MANPDGDRPTEIDLEMDQRARLMELFSFVETFSFVVIETVKSFIIQRIINSL